MRPSQARANTKAGLDRQVARHLLVANTRDRESGSWHSAHVIQMSPKSLLAASQPRERKQWFSASMVGSSCQARPTDSCFHLSNRVG